MLGTQYIIVVTVLQRGFYADFAGFLVSSQLIGWLEMARKSCELPG
jgi:hypothetical protein